jgi:hypothetical protein
MASGVSLLAETCTIVQDTASAQTAYKLLLPFSALNVADSPEQIRGSVSRYLAILAALLNRQEDATRHFENALQMNERMSTRPWLAHTQRDYAQTLIQHGDGQRATELLTAALATYRELDMKSHTAEVAQALRR